MKKKMYTDYKTAANWGCSLILCNNLPNFDCSIWDNMRFNYYDEDDNVIDIYQWFITDLSDSGVEYMEKTFDLLYTYSDTLDCYVLCVPHCGTSWDYVPCEVLSEDWFAINKKG